MDFDPSPWREETLQGVIPLPTGRQAITPLNGAFGERTLQFYSERDKKGENDGIRPEGNGSGDQTH